MMVLALVGTRRRLVALSWLAAAAVFAGCGAGATPPSSVTPTAGAATGAGAKAAPLTNEEMREYDANEGRCHNDGGSVRDVGSVDAYCAFAQRSNDFHLVETSHAKQAAGAEE